MLVRFYSNNRHRQIQLKKSKQGHFNGSPDDKMEGGLGRQRFERSVSKLPSSVASLRGDPSLKLGLGGRKGGAVKFNKFRLNATCHYLLRRSASRFIRFKNKRNTYKRLLSGGLLSASSGYVRSRREAQWQQVIRLLRRNRGVFTSWRRRIVLRRSLARFLDFLERKSLPRLGRTANNKPGNITFYDRTVLPRVDHIMLRQFAYLGLVNISLLNILSKKELRHRFRGIRYARFQKEVYFGKLWDYFYAALLGYSTARRLLGRWPRGSEKSLCGSSWRTILLQAGLYRAGRQLSFLLRGRTRLFIDAASLPLSSKKYRGCSGLRSWKARVRRWNSLREVRGAFPALDRLDRLQFRTVLPSPVLPARRKSTLFSRRRFGRDLFNALVSSTTAGQALTYSDLQAFLPTRQRYREKVRPEKDDLIVFDTPLFGRSSPKKIRNRRQRGSARYPIRRRDIRKEFQAFIRRSPGRLVFRDGRWVLRIKRRDGKIDYRPLKLQDLRPNTAWRTRAGGGRRKWVFKSIKRNRLWSYLTRTRTPYDSVILRAQDFKRTKRIFSYLQWKFGYSRSLRRKKSLSRRMAVSHTFPGEQLAFYALLRDPQNNFSIVQNRGRSTLLNYLVLSMGNLGRAKSRRGLRRWHSRHLGAWSLNRMYFINDTIGVAPTVHRAVGSPNVRPNRVTHFAGSVVNPFKPQISVIDPANFGETSKLLNHPSAATLTQLGVYHSMSSRFKSSYLAAILKPRFRELLAMKQVQYGKMR